MKKIEKVFATICVIMCALILILSWGQKAAAKANRPDRSETVPCTITIEKGDTLLSLYETYGDGYSYKEWLKSLDFINHTNFLDDPDTIVAGRNIIALVEKDVLAEMGKLKK